MLGSNLLLPTFFFFLLSYFSLKNALGNRNAIYLCIIKFSIPWIWLYINNFEYSPLKDESGYYLKSVKLFEGIISNGLIDVLNVKSYVLSSHFLFYIWNAFLFLIFGESPYISIIANIFLSCFSGRIFLKVLLTIGVTARNSSFITIFYLLSPSIICWSSFHNLREVFLSVFLFLMLLQMLRFYEKQNLKNTLLLSFTFLSMFTIRFYFIIIATLTLSIALFKRANAKSLSLFITSSITISSVLVYIFFSSIKNLDMQFGNITYGFIRFILTPNPLNIDPLYYFILPDAIFHALMFPIFIVGMVSSYKEYQAERKIFVLFLFVFLIVIFYAILSQSQGPRQRFPISFFFTFCQYEGLRYLIKSLSRKRRVC